MTDTFTEGTHAAAAVLQEANGSMSRSNLKIAASQIVLACALLGMIGGGDAGAGTQTVAAAVALPTNTAGAGTVGSLTGDAHAAAGRWQLICIEPAANAGTFNVIRPNGTVEGRATVAVAYNGALNFTISDATDFAAGDGFYIDVSYADGATAGQYKAWDPDATDGSQVAVAMSLYAVTTGVGETADVAAITSQADLNANCISWPADVTDDQKAAAVASLATKFVRVR